MVVLLEQLRTVDVSRQVTELRQLLLLHITDAPLLMHVIRKRRHTEAQLLVTSGNKTLQEVSDVAKVAMSEYSSRLHKYHNVHIVARWK